MSNKLISQVQKGDNWLLIEANRWDVKIAVASGNNKYSSITMNRSELVQTMTDILRELNLTQYDLKGIASFAMLKAEGKFLNEELQSE